jgi:acyl-CoA oxidase
VLRRLAALHGAALIENDLDWYLEHGVLSARTASNIHRLVGRLSAELAVGSVALVDAFAIPDAVLDAPIGLEPNRPEMTS